jgi:hypothetical protein
MKLFRQIPHKCWYKVTGNNGLTHTPCEKTCMLCGESIHLPWDGFLKDGAKWVDGKFPWKNRT